VDWIQLIQYKDQWQTVVNAAVPVDANALLGLLVSEGKGSMILPNVATCVFTKLRCVTFEKRPDVVKVYVGTCRRPTAVTGPNVWHPVYKSVPLKGDVKRDESAQHITYFYSHISHVYVSSLPE
jgi:hypothetical protein